MLSVAAAIERILVETEPLPAEYAPLAEALGQRLASDATADVDSPPHDKSLVDGYAIRTADLPGGQGTLLVTGEIVAGRLPPGPLASGGAMQIMTGAPLPDGADAVVMVERTKSFREGDEEYVRIDEARLAPGQFIARQGAAFRRGDVLLRKGHRVRTIETGLLAEIGLSIVPVVRRPRVAILATGNELVPASQTPPPSHIRNSNEPLLLACVNRAGAIGRGLGIARDRREELRERIQLGFDSDVLLLSGGVSAGVLDLVPEVLVELGTEQVFHKVNIRPGKPLWFGVCRRSGQRTLVFGLPGNPVSSFVCCELFVRPALDRLSGGDGSGLQLATASLTASFTHFGDRESYLPASLHFDRDGLSVEVPPWHGSADLRALSAANALARFEPGTRTYASGEPIDVLWLA